MSVYCIATFLIVQRVGNNVFNLQYVKIFLNVIELEYNCPISLTMVNVERLGLLDELCNG